MTSSPLLFFVTERVKEGCNIKEKMTRENRINRKIKEERKALAFYMTTR
jgi:hypothetical protein